MDFDDPPPSFGGAPGPCACGCLCCGPSAAFRRSLKRRLDLGEVPPTDIARVEAENEAAALREALASHQLSVQNLLAELDEERNASASAASEAMSMILRLQREKAEAQMESRQFRRFAEEKMAHDQQEISALEDLLFKRDQAIQSLSCEVQAYKHRLASFGIGDSFPSNNEPQTPDSLNNLTPRSFDYPPLRCLVPDVDNDEADLEKHPFGETPRDRFQSLESRICQLERMPSRVMEKGVVVGHSPRNRPRHLRRMSVDSYHQGSENGTDRVYTIDAVHEDSPREFGDEAEIKKLYARLQALEADRESMRQTIISMGTDKAQIVLLKEIAQHLCKEVAVPEKRVVKKPSFVRIFSVVSAVKWITSFIFWRKKSARSKYAFGISGNNIGLLLLLEKSPRMRQRRFLTRTLTDRCTPSAH